MTDDMDLSVHTEDVLWRCNCVVVNTKMNYNVCAVALNSSLLYALLHSIIYDWKYVNSLSDSVIYCCSGCVALPLCLHLATSEMWCWSGRREILKKNCLCATVVCTIIMMHKGISSSYREILKKNCLCATVVCTIIMMHKGISSSYRSVDCIGLWSCLV